MTPGKKKNSPLKMLTKPEDQSKITQQLTRNKVLGNEGLGLELGLSIRVSVKLVSGYIGHCRTFWLQYVVSNASGKCFLTIK